MKKIVSLLKSKFLKTSKVETLFSEDKVALNEVGGNYCEDCC